MMISCNVETGARKDLMRVSSKYWDYFNKVFVLRIFEYLPFGKEFLAQFLGLRLKSMKFLDNQAMDVRKE